DSYRHDALTEWRAADSLEQSADQHGDPLRESDRGRREPAAAGDSPDQEPSDRPDRIQIARKRHTEAGCQEEVLYIQPRISAAMSVGCIECAVEHRQRWHQDRSEER